MLAQGKAKSLSVTCSRLHEDIILADRIISFFLNWSKTFFIICGKMESEKLNCAVRNHVYCFSVSGILLLFWLHCFRVLNSEE